jgi:hypothetical protein
VSKAERRLTVVPPSSRCGHARQLAAALGRPQAEIDASWNLTTYWPSLLDVVASLLPPGGEVESFCPEHPDLLLYMRHGKAWCPHGHQAGG